ncbi:MAG: glycosyltransferase family 4 protein [Acidobacteriota bacterium]|nr:glycosyltransferase family 4 protein [Acidobacteriota bacterium]MDH3786822.1 glycosyltransferase family 4 protein [Acidobacteriota bacterium]
MSRHAVAHVITRLELGGAQQNTLYCTAHHDRRRFDVSLLAGAGGILDDEATRIDDATVRLMETLRHPIAPLDDLRAVRELTRFFRDNQIELVHTHSSKAGILGRLAARRAGVKAIVHTVHGWSFNDTQSLARRQLYVQLERIAARWTDRMVVVSAQNREDGLLRGIGRPEQYRVIHSGIDIEQFRRPQVSRQETRRALGYDDETIVVGTIACLKPQKAPLDFVAAAARAHATDSRLRFVIAGDGELRPRVEAAIARHRLQDVVQLLGWRDDVVELLHGLDLFVLTSLFEGLPRAVLQAMAAGVPVVATAVDGTPEVVDDGKTGLLVPKAEPVAAADAILRLAGDPTLASSLVQGATEGLGRKFEIGQMVRDLDDLYGELLSTSPVSSATSSRRSTSGPSRVVTEPEVQ